jgi:hypothetical protein
MGHNGNNNKLRVISEISVDACLHEHSLIYHNETLSLTWSIKYSVTSTGIPNLVKRRFTHFNSVYWRMCSYEGFCSGVIHPKLSLGLIVLRFSNLTQTHTHTPGRTPLNKWSTRHRCSYLYNTQQRKETKTHAFCWIQTRNRAAAGLLLWWDDHRDRHDISLQQ